MTQDIAYKNLIHLDSGTLADLFALSEMEGQLPGHLLRELDSFARQKTRELWDLPDGLPLQQELDLLAAVDPSRVPVRLRAVVGELRAKGTLEASTQRRIAALQQAWEQIEPDPPRPGSGMNTSVQRPAVPRRLQMPEDKPARSKRGASPSPGRSEATGSPTPAARQDQDRSAWIRAHVLQRLDTHRERGLKQSILVAGTRHACPFGEMQGAEVLAELRELKRSGQVRNSAGRWIRVRRLGW